MNELSEVSAGGARQSPLNEYQGFLRRGQLAYQWDESTGRPVFYPRVIAPGSGSSQLSWRISAGLGTVYSVTAISPKNEEPYNVALVDMDEGYRLMSRVEGIPADQVRIGMRVKVRVVDAGADQSPYPVFDPA